mmetsp:Transcript_20361/g.42466  ORF Transcript_20361/g.42466 Transcript_20361/m.42466 type:complete len:234 (-) Transcript_20361:1154-1855(-)
MVLLRNKVKQNISSSSTPVFLTHHHRHHFRVAVVGKGRIEIVHRFALFLVWLGRRHFDGRARIQCIVDAYVLVVGLIRKLAVVVARKGGVNVHVQVHGAVHRAGGVVHVVRAATIVVVTVRFLFLVEAQDPPPELSQDHALALLLLRCLSFRGVGLFRRNPVVVHVMEASLKLVQVQEVLLHAQLLLGTGRAFRGPGKRVVRIHIGMRCGRVVAHSEHRHAAATGVRSAELLW